MNSESRNPSLGFATKAKGSQGRRPKRVGERRLTLPSELPFGSWSPGGVPNFQRAMEEVKTFHIRELFISLESY